MYSVYIKIRDKYIYADNVATTKLDVSAFEAMKPYYLDEYGNPTSFYSISRGNKKALKNSREVIVGTKPFVILTGISGTR